MSFERYSHTLYFWELSWNIDAFYHTMKRVSISVFTDFSQSSLFAMWNGNTIRRGQEFLQSPNSSSARWRYFITTTRILHVFTFLCKLEPLLLKLRRDYQIYKMKGIAMTPSCKWPITCTSKDKPGDLLKFFFSQAYNSCRFKELSCAFRERQRIILACPACRRFWHAGHAGY